MPFGLTKNCHYISRFLTRPWEDSGRWLRFYDFDTDAFEVKPSRCLFAGDGINSQPVEGWLGRTVEQPLGAARQRLAKGDTTSLQDWSFYRSAVLMLWLQGVRVRTLADEEARRELDTLVTLKEQELDLIVQEMRRSYDLRLIRTVCEPSRLAPLSVPSSGVFRFVVADSGCLTGHSIGIALPIDVHCALVATPTEQQGELDLSLLSGSLANYSTGTSNARRVVVMPRVYEQAGEKALRTALRETRRVNDLLMAEVKAARALVGDALEEEGLDPRRDGAGRMPA